VNAAYPGKRGIELADDALRGNGPRELETAGRVFAEDLSLSGVIYNPESGPVILEPPIAILHTALLFSLP
jgi:hypothetical protein